MKNSKKGFIVPLLLAIIAILVIGGGVYVYKNKQYAPVVKSETRVVSSIVPSSGPSGTKIIISGSGFKQGDKVGWAGGSENNPADTGFDALSISPDGKQIEFIIPPLEIPGNVMLGTYNLYIGDSNYLPFTVTKDETANWKTYTSEKYGFTFKYPADKEVTVGDVSGPNGSIEYQFYINSLDYFRVVAAIKEKLDFDELLTVYAKNNNLSKKGTYLNLGEALLVSNMYALVQHGDYVYTFLFVGNDSPYKSDTDLIRSSFRFTN